MSVTRTFSRHPNFQKTQPPRCRIIIIEPRTATLHSRIPQVNLSNKHNLLSKRSPVPNARSFPALARSQRSLVPSARSFPALARSQRSLVPSARSFPSLARSHRSLVPSARSFPSLARSQRSLVPSARSFPALARSPLSLVPSARSFPALARLLATGWFAHPLAQPLATRSPIPRPPLQP
jgi:hypothetical protein